MADDVLLESRACIRCEVVSPLEDYQMTPSGGRRKVCRACRNAASVRRNKEWCERHPKEYKTRARAISKRAYYAANPEVIREQTRLARFSRYGITEQSYDSMLESQAGACAVCHACCPGCRSCGACVRGLLCQHCNHGLGKFRDRPEYLAAAMAYLVKEG